MDINTIKEFLEENEDIFNEAIEELDSFNGYLGDDRYFDMDMLDDLYQDQAPTEILDRAFYGYDDDDSFTDGNGNKIYRAFNPNRDFFTYNGYGNLVSTNYKDYSDRLDDYFIGELIENSYYLTLDDELTELIDQYIEEEEQEA